mmetsp:Transcript_73555/g.143915  ORF Transcript_73555/g.143915 Transcript_73555/m.143915 type:complete len:221 (-) Transcript_73555:19-681(-)
MGYRTFTLNLIFSLCSVRNRVSALSMAAASQNKLRFITNKMCPFAQRTWICLEETGLPYSFEEISLYGAGGKPAWFRKLNPKGEVPVLVIGDKAVCGSEDTLNAIETLPDSSFKVDTSSNVHVWRDRINKELLPVGKRLVLGADKQGVHDLLRSLEPHVVGPYLAGDFSLADISAAPFLQRLHSEYGIPQDCPRLAEVWGLLQDRPSVRKTIQQSWWWWW